MYIEDLKYFIERTDTNEWFTVVRAHSGNFWTRNPIEARAFNTKSEAFKGIENPINYDGVNYLEGIAVEVTEHMFIDGEPKIKQQYNGELNADIRNKLSPLQNLITMVENGDVSRCLILQQLHVCKVAIEYLSNIGIKEYPICHHSNPKDCDRPHGGTCKDLG